MLIAFFIALVVGIAALYWLVLKNSAEKIAAQYSILAQTLDLELNQPEPKMRGFIRPEPSVYGRHKDRELSISVPGKGLQNTRQIETVLKLEVAHKQFAAQLTASGLLGGFRQRDSGGMKRWKGSDEVFAAAIDARTHDAETLSRLIDPGTAQSLMAILKAGRGTIYIGGGVMAYAELGLIANDSVRERFESVLALFIEMAEALESS